MVKRLRHRPFTAVSGVRIPVGSPFGSQRYKFEAKRGEISVSDKKGKIELGFNPFSVEDMNRISGISRLPTVDDAIKLNRLERTPKSRAIDRVKEKVAKYSKSGKKPDAIFFKIWVEENESKFKTLTENEVREIIIEITGEQFKTLDDMLADLK